MGTCEHSNRTLWDKKSKGENIKLLDILSRGRSSRERDKIVMRKLDGLVKAFPAVYKLIGQTKHDKTYSMPKSYISYRKPRNISEVQREQARQQMKKINKCGN